MVSKVKTVAFSGMKPIEIVVEAQISPGISSFNIVGLPDKSVAEAKERVRSSFFNIGLGFPSKRVTINMAPADIPKGGSHYDLPIALAILGAMEIIDTLSIERYIVIGELGLDGSLAYVSGSLCASMMANEKDMSIICPKVCEKEVILSGNDSIVAAPSLSSVVNHILGRSQITTNVDIRDLKKERKFDIDMSDIYGQDLAKRALEISASGGHNILMIGPPGSGKSMLSERIQTILPDLTPKEALETTCIYSISGIGPSDGLINIPPYRSPHHSASLVSMVGGGMDAKPGEISLSHNGVLFLDELPEFQKSVIESLRQPLETHNITISRAKEHITYPANIQLIAAMNPCRCGFFGVYDKECPKAPKCAIEYRNKISGPILDRFDMVVYVNNIDISDMFQKSKGERSDVIRGRVVSARNIQMERNQKFDDSLYLNSKIRSGTLERILNLDSKTREFFLNAVEKMKISARGFHKILRVSRTIADLEMSQNVRINHVAEAMQYRLLDI